jgi:hypothetical protein
MLGRRLEVRFDLAGEAIFVILATERPLDVLQGRGAVAPGKGDRLDLQRPAARAALFEDAVMRLTA